MPFFLFVLSPGSANAFSVFDPGWHELDPLDRLVPLGRFSCEVWGLGAAIHVVGFVLGCGLVTCLGGSFGAGWRCFELEGGLCEQDEA